MRTRSLLPCTLKGMAENANSIRLGGKDSPAMLGIFHRRRYHPPPLWRGTAPRGCDFSPFLSELQRRNCERSYAGDHPLSRFISL